MALSPEERQAAVRDILIQAVLSGQPPPVAPMLTRYDQQLVRRWFRKCEQATGLISQLQEELHLLFDDLSQRTEDEAIEVRIVTREKKIDEILLDLRILFDEMMQYLYVQTEPPLPSSKLRR